jgi:hypothetical protein
MHACPQRPQLVVLVATAASHPVESMPSQLAKPGSHAPIAQPVAMHSAVAFA